MTAGSASPAAGLEAEQQGAIVALHFGQGAGGVGAHRGGGFGERVYHVSQHLFAADIGTRGQRQQADAAQWPGGVLLAAPHRLHLNVYRPAQKRRRLAMTEILERLGDGLLAPTLGIALDGVFEQAVEGAQQVRKHFRRGQVRRDVGGFSGHQVDAIRQRLAQRGTGFGGSRSAQAAEGIELFFNPAVGHGINLLFPRIPVLHPS